MIFTASLIHRIRTGQKTTVRRLMHGDEPAPFRARRKGSTVGVRKQHGGPEECLVVLEDWWPDVLGDITDPELKREGFDRMEDFELDWLERYDRGCLPLDTEDEVDARFSRIWARKRVWVVSFHFTADIDLYLAPAGRLSDEHGYTRNPMRALEGVPVQDPALLDPLWRAHAEARRQKARRVKPPRETPEERLGALREAALTRRVDIANDLRVIHERTDRIAKKLDDAA